MRSNDKASGAFFAAKPCGGDLVERVLHQSLRATLFGSKEEVLLGRLQVEASLGQGAMGAIVSAFDPVLNRHVAIKSLRPGMGDEEQLLAEARLLAKLDHPNVISIFDVVQEEGLYLVMEQVDGGDLRDWMEKKHSFSEVVPLFQKIAQGLAAAHELGIVHCDVKPENVVVSGDRPRLIDFGLAHHASEGESHGGTRAYLAPERIAGAGGSQEADQYAFFVTMVEAITGVRSAGVQWDIQQADIPSWLEGVIRRGLQNKSEDRYPSMHAVAEALSPPTKSWRPFAFGALVLLGAAIALLWGMRGDEAAQPCRGSEERIATVWNPSMSEAIQQRFSEIGSAGSPKAIAAVQSELSSYASAWTAQRTQSCRATAVFHSQREELWERSAHCFERSLRSFRGVVDLFATQANEKVVTNAQAIVRQLPDVYRCSSPSELGVTQPLPKTAEELARLESVEETFEEIKKADRRGDYSDALALSDSVLQETRDLQYAPFAAEHLALRAAVFVTLGKLELAEQTFREAALAASKAKDDVKVAEVWIRLLDLLAQQGRLDEALLIETVARTSAEKISDNAPLQARLHNTLGGIYMGKGRYPEAAEAYGKAMELQRGIGKEGNLAYGPAIGNLGLAKWQMGEPEEALRLYRMALEIMRPQLGADHSTIAYVRQNIAALEKQFGHNELAKQSFLEVVRIWRESLGDQHSNLAYPYEQLVSLLSEEGDFDGAREMAEKALALREQQYGGDHVLVIQSLSVLIALYVEEGSASSLQAAEQGIGKATAIATRLGKPADHQVVFVLDLRAQLHERLGELQASLEDRRRVLELRRELFGEMHVNTGHSHKNLAGILYKVGKRSESARHLLAAQDIFSKVENLAREIDVRKIRARLLAELGQRRKAIEALNLALEKSTGLPSETKGLVSEQIQMQLDGLTKGHEK